MKTVAATPKTIPMVVGPRGVVAVLQQLNPAALKFSVRKAEWLVSSGGNELRLPESKLPVKTVRKVWYTSQIVDWAAGLALIPPRLVPATILDGERAHPWQLLGVPAPEPLWTLVHIAERFGVSVGTIESRWLWTPRRIARTRRKPPEAPLIEPDLVVEGTPLWRPDGVLKWGRQLGKLDDDYQPCERHGSRWQPKETTLEEVTDIFQDLVDAGTAWTARQIPGRFGVSYNTFKMWRTVHSAGTNFPESHGTTRSGDLVWLVEDIYEWARQSNRVDENGELCPGRVGRPAAGGRLAVAVAA